MRLEPDEPVDDVHARLLQLARPPDVGLLVEPRLDLHQRHDLLARRGRVDQRVDDGGVARGAVERLLDREHVRVGGGLLDEPLHARGERVVGVVDEHVALAQRGEDARGGLAARRTPGAVAGTNGSSLRSGRSTAWIVHSAVRSSRPGTVTTSCRVDVELAQQQLQHVLAHRVGDLEPHRRPEPAAGQLAFERLQQVLVAVLLDLEVGVAGDAERVAPRRPPCP